MNRTATFQRKPKKRSRSTTGFSPKVKLQVRARAGEGEPKDALCEACGIWLGRYGGQVQHIIGRGMGGCRDEVINSVVNAALLCGTPFDGCHGLATAFNAELGKRGFWLKRDADPATSAMVLWSGATVRRSADGSYVFEAPERAA